MISIFFKNFGRWHHGLMSRLDGEKVLAKRFSKHCKMLWLVRVSPATELPAVSKAYPADIGVSNASFNVNDEYSH